MTWQSHSFAFASALVVLTPISSALADGMKLEDAVHLALQNNERALKAPLRLEIAEGALDRARDAFFPTLVAGGASSIRPDPPSHTSAVTNSGTLTLSQPILNPSAIPQYQQQSHARDSEKWGAVQDKRQLAFDTAKAFVQALAAEHVLVSAKRKADTSKANLEEAQARADAGLNSTNDVTKAQLQLATSNGQVAQAQGNVDRAYIALSFLVGQAVAPPLVPPDATTEAAKRYEQSQNNQVKSALERHQDAIKAAQARRPDVVSAHEHTESLRYSAQETLYRLIPSLSAAGQIRFAPDPLPSENAIDETITVNLTWTIFDGGFRYADRRSRLAQLESSDLDEKMLKRSVATDVDTARASLKSARANLESATEAVAASKKNIEETLILYKQGLSTALDVTDANDQQFQAEVTLESAKLTMEQAYLDLRSALGFGPLDEDMGTGTK